MKGMREIRTRIRAVKNTAQITRAMELVASSKMKKAQDGARRGDGGAVFMQRAADAGDEGACL